MSQIQLITDVVKIFTDATDGPLPSISDRAGVKALLVKVIPDLADLAYDAAGMQAEHVDVEAVKASVPVGKLGDGTLLQLIIANLPQIAAFIKLFFPTA